MNNTPLPNTITPFFKQFGKRLRYPFLDLRFWSFFITGIIIFGGLGIWIECAKFFLFSDNNQSSSKLYILNTTIILYCATTLGGVLSQVFLDTSIEQNVKSGSWLIIIILYFFIIFLIISQNLINESCFLIFSVILAFFSLMMSWLVNGYNEGLHEPPVELDDITGAKSTKDPSILNENLEGWTI